MGRELSQKFVPYTDVITDRVGHPFALEVPVHAGDAAHLPFRIAFGTACDLPRLLDGSPRFFSLPDLRFDGGPHLPGSECGGKVVGLEHIPQRIVDVPFRVFIVPQVKVEYCQVQVEVSYPALVSVLPGGIQCLVIEIKGRILPVEPVIKHTQVVVHADVLFQVLHFGQVGQYAFLHLQRAGEFTFIEEQGGLLVEQNRIKGRAGYAFHSKSLVETSLSRVVFAFSHKRDCLVIEMRQKGIGRQFFSFAFG